MWFKMRLRIADGHFSPFDRGAWQATVHGVTRVGHDLVNKPPPGNYRHVKLLS